MVGKLLLLPGLLHFTVFIAQRNQSNSDAGAGHGNW
jgi:hypothetical protein